MLTAEQIQEIAKKHGIGIYPQERDYIQNIFLYLLYTRSEDFIFKGGTALKIIYKSPRYSEDLDFNSLLPISKAESVFARIAADFGLFGIEAAIKDLRGKAGQGFGCRLSYQGPLFDGRPQTKSSIRLDVSLRGEKLQVEKQLLRSEYPDLGTVFVNCSSLQDIFAEKIRALLIRGKPRDLYDIWFLVMRGVKFDEKLTNQKLKIYDLKFDQKHFIQEINREKKAWKEELQSLIPLAPNFEEIKKQVLAALNLQ